MWRCVRRVSQPDRNRISKVSRTVSTSSRHIILVELSLGAEGVYLEFRRRSSAETKYPWEKGEIEWQSLLLL